MKRITLLITAVAVLAFSGTAHAAQTTYIGCSKWAGEDPKPRVAPKSCSTWYPWVDHAHSHNFEGLRWHSWGAAQATATGFDVYHGMGAHLRTPVRLTVSRPRGFETYDGGVDMPAFTRMSVRYRDGDVAKVRLAWGFDLWPDY